MGHFYLKILPAFIMISVVTLFSTLFSHAALANSDSFSDARTYYTIEEKFTNSEEFKPPLTVLSETFEKALKASKGFLFLMRLEQHENRPPLPRTPYDRRNQFGTWLNDPLDDTCYNTRTKVLIRDSKTAVRFKEDNRCAVESGKWFDPYTARNYYSPADLQIDHMVPLKHAYMAGAWKWSTKKRCLYANDIGADYHLIPVLAHENMSKGDSSPEEYLPPADSSVCQYIDNWLTIKAVWKLLLLPGEAEAIRDAISEYGCDMKKMALTEKQLRAERTRIAKGQEVCEKMAERLEARKAQP